MGSLIAEPAYELFLKVAKGLKVADALDFDRREHSRTNGLSSPIFSW